MSERVQYKIDLDGNALIQLQKINAEYSKLNENMKGGAGGSSSKGGLVLGLTAAAGAMAALGYAAKATIDKFAEFQKIKTVLQTTFSSSFIAESEFSRLQDFATKTPFQLNNLAESYTKLVNRGFKPTNKQLTQLGDLASSVGKDFDQVVEAVLDAETGEFERLKELGIKARVHGDKVKMAFKGQTVEIDNSTEAIRKYITDLGSLAGVTGSMGNMTMTIQGKESNIADQWDQFKSNMGEALNPLYSTLLDISANTLGMLNQTLGKTNDQKIIESENKLKLAFEEYSKQISVDYRTGKVNEYKAESIKFMANAFGGEFKAFMKVYDPNNAIKEMNDLIDPKTGGIVKGSDKILKDFVTAFAGGTTVGGKGHGIYAYSILQSQLESETSQLADLKSQKMNMLSTVGGDVSKMSTYEYTDKYLPLENKIKELENHIPTLKDILSTQDISYKKIQNELSKVGVNPSKPGSNVVTPGTAKELINAAPKTFNVYINKMGEIQEVNIMSDKDEKEFQQRFTDTILNALSTVSVQIQ